MVKTLECMKNITFTSFLRILCIFTECGWLAIKVPRFITIFVCVFFLLKDMTRACIFNTFSGQCGILAALVTIHLYASGLGLTGALVFAHA